MTGDYGADFDIVTLQAFSGLNGTGTLLRTTSVERLTGRGDDYATAFTGWVGSLRISLEDQRVYIAAISGDGIVLEVHAITKVEKYGNSIEFETTDLTPFSNGMFQHRGKVWAADDGSLKVEMIRRDSPRRWVNLSVHGLRFLKDSGLERLRLGI